jgi:hypothetical protein
VASEAASDIRHSSTTIARKGIQVFDNAGGIILGGQRHFLLNLAFEERLGLDSDPVVLKSAEIVRLMHFRGNARFAAYSFPGDGLDGVFDAVIMVNWLHGIQPDPSKAGITRIFRDHAKPGGCLVIDTVSKDGYPYRHDADFLLGELGGTVEQIGAYPCGRRVWKVTKEAAGVP